MKLYNMYIHMYLNLRENLTAGGGDCFLVGQPIAKRAHSLNRAGHAIIIMIIIIIKRSNRRHGANNIFSHARFDVHMYLYVEHLRLAEQHKQQRAVLNWGGLIIPFPFLSDDGLEWIFRRSPSAGHLNLRM